MDAIADLVGQGAREGVFPGAVWKVGREHKVISQGALGLAVQDPVRLEAQAGTLYDLASVTKVIVSAALMRMVEQGRLTLDDRLSRWVPGFDRGDKALLRVWHLMVHTSGLAPSNDLPAVEESSLPQLAQQLVEAPLARAPGTYVEYSSWGYILLGWIMERAGDASLDVLIDQQVNHVLGTQFLFNPSSELRASTASTELHPHRAKMVWGEVHDEKCYRMGGIAGHAGLFGTVDDVYALGQAMVGSPSPLMHPTTRTLMIRNHTAHLNLARGLGWQGKDRFDSPAGDLMSDSTFGHTGFTGTSLFCDPITREVAVLLTNRVHPTRANTAILRFRRVFHNVAAAQMDGGQGLEGDNIVKHPFRRGES